MPSEKRGRRTSTPSVEVANISPHGLWVWVTGQEYYLPFASYPWLADATVRQIHNVELLHARHLHWPDLDEDVDLDALVHPERYPLPYRR